MKAAPTRAGAARPQPALVLLAVVAGVSVANLYYAQPLAAMMASSMRVSASRVGLTMTLCQLGYALGMLLLVPLGDGRERRGLMLKTALAASLMLVLVAAAPSFSWLAASSLALGVSSCLPQMALPFAVGLVPLAERGRAIGLVMGGLLTGILLSRTASGALGAVLGWRMTFACAAALMVVTAVALRFALPPQAPEQPLGWAGIVRSLAGVARSQPLLWRHSWIGAAGFASFSAFWSTFSFHMARLGHGSTTAGLFGVIGVAGIVVAPLVGRLSTQVRPTAINVVGLGAVMAAFAVLGNAGSSLATLALGVVLLDAGVQASHLANQTVLFGLAAALRSRINAIYMVSYFLGGALGTALAAWTWERWGWAFVSLLGAGFAGAGLLPLAASREPRRIPSA